MLLFELFANDAGTDSGSMINDLRQQVLDYLTPMVAQNVVFVTVQQIIDNLRDMQSGLNIDRGLVMQLLNPDQVKMVKKIEGDRIYLQMPDPTRAVGKDDQQKDAEKVNKLATDQAKKAVKASDRPTL